ncbi:MAG: histidinol-phosphatase, partial [Lachnospiraceae bacterium]|nr:histidinol-phosphatase [Lachnospiraceae bacterium]
MLVNYHTHTARCGHASGEDRSYAERGLERGLKVLGFSDHVPVPFEDGHESRHRIPLARLEEYVESVLSLREEFRGRIRILLGFEVEYYPDYFEKVLELLAPYPVDYLLLGQHANHSSESFWNQRPFQEEEVLKTYVDRVLEGLSTRRFLYVCHPDLPQFTGDPKIYGREMQRLCRGVKALGIPLEFNLLGLREERHYPTPAFWKIAAREGNQVIFGCDAHSPEAVADPKELAAARELAKEYGLEPLLTDLSQTVPAFDENQQHPAGGHGGTNPGNSPE